MHNWSQEVVRKWEKALLFYFSIYRRFNSFIQSQLPIRVRGSQRLVMTWWSDIGLTNSEGTQWSHVQWLNMCANTVTSEGPCIEYHSLTSNRPVIMLDTITHRQNNMQDIRLLYNGSQCNHGPIMLLWPFCLCQIGSKYINGKRCNWNIK